MIVTRLNPGRSHDAEPDDDERHDDEQPSRASIIAIVGWGPELVGQARQRARRHPWQFEPRRGSPERRHFAVHHHCPSSERGGHARQSRGGRNHARDEAVVDAPTNRQCRVCEKNMPAQQAHTQCQFIGKAMNRYRFVKALNRCKSVKALDRYRFVEATNRYKFTN